MATNRDTCRSLLSSCPTGLSPWEHLQHVVLLQLTSVKLGIQKQDLVHWLLHETSQTAAELHQRLGASTKSQEESCEQQQLRSLTCVSAFDIAEDHSVPLADLLWRLAVTPCEAKAFLEHCCAFGADCPRGFHCVNK